MIVRWWTTHGETPGERTNLSLGEHELCQVVSNQQLEPTEESHEGYMGNYGNTAELWYQLSAVLLIPQEYAFATRAEGNPCWALTELNRLVQAGDIKQALAHTKTLEPFWKRATS